MVSRKQRLRVVLDTNVFVRAFKARSRSNWHQQILRLWLIERKLQLIVSPELIEEYIGIFNEVLNMDDETVRGWKKRFEDDPRASVMKLGQRCGESRDPDDNVLLATAMAGDASFLITNDRDLLEVSVDFKRKIDYEILKPQVFLKRWRESL